MAKIRCFSTARENLSAGGAFRISLTKVLSNCYTGQEFIDECGGDVEKAERLFWYCDWQHPSSAVDELADDEEE